MLNYKKFFKGALLLPFFSLIFSSCFVPKKTSFTKPNTTSPPANYSLPKIKLYMNSTGYPNGIGPIPNWTRHSGSSFVGLGDDGKRYLFFVFEAEGESKEVALTSAEQKAKTKLSESVRLAVYSYVVKYSQANNDTSETYLEKLEGSLTKTVLNGIRPMGEYWEEFFEVYPNGFMVGPKYRAVVRYGILYEKWEKLVRSYLEK